VKRKKRRRLKGPIHGRIAELRGRMEMSQEELADACGVDKTAVSHWENGVARPDLSRLLAVADALGVSVGELIDGEEAA
jgi:transcriptional regulator with XRE-family HTH domain